MYTHLLQMPESITCPSCHHTFNPNSSAARGLQCPACGALLPGIQAAGTDELEGTRIARIANERRAIARTRGYYIVGLAACIIAALQLLWQGIQALPTAWIRTMGYAAAAVVLVVLAIELRKRVIALGESLSRSSLSEPVSPPDFTNLSDGSQRARNLDNIIDDETP